MTWITENPWPLLLLLAGAAVVSLILGDAKGRMIALAFVLIAAGVYFLESAIVTPAEDVDAAADNARRSGRGFDGDSQSDSRRCTGAKGKGETRAGTGSNT